MSGGPLEKITREIHESYYRRIELAVTALQGIVENPSAAKRIAAQALEGIKTADEEATGPLDIKYKFVKIEGMNSIYEIIDNDYGGCTWTVTLDPKERGDLLSSIRTKTIEKRMEYDSTLEASD